MSSSAATRPGLDLLDGQVALVTGAGQGIGEAIARAMATAGAAVVIATRRAETGRPVADSITATGSRALFVECDVTDGSAIDRAVQIAASELGGLDVLVHNAISSAGPPAPIQSVTDDVLEGQIATAVTASFHCARAAHPYLLRRPGSMILITSPAGLEGSAHLPWYATVKGAQRGFLRSLAREWGPSGIRVNAIAPVARTPALAGAIDGDPGLEDRLISRTPLGRIGDPLHDIAPVAVFLASTMARHITGQTITVDGGGFMAP